VGCEQIGHKGQQVRRNLPFESARIAHRLDEADGAALGQDVVVPATVASDGKPAKRLPLRRQISNTNHVQAGPVWPLTKHATRADRSTPAYRQPAPQQRRQAPAQPVRQPGQLGGRGTLGRIVFRCTIRSGYQPAQIRKPAIVRIQSHHHLPAADTIRPDGGEGAPGKSQASAVGTTLGAIQTNDLTVLPDLHERRPRTRARSRTELQDWA